MTTLYVPICRFDPCQTRTQGLKTILQRLPGLLHRGLVRPEGRKWAIFAGLGEVSR